MLSILLGISSGIAAVKMVSLVELLRKKQIDVQVVLTKNAAHIVDPTDLAAASGHKVWTKLFESNFSAAEVLKNHQVDHIKLADSADLMVIAPATANIVAKLAHGIADDFLTTTVLAMTKPVVIFPSMNVHMWQHPSVQANLKKLKSYGYIVIEPDSGPLACGYEGKGRLPSVTEIARIIQLLISKQTLLKGRRVLVTYGGTQEKIDDARLLTNLSSGKMGAAIADACLLSGAEVTVLRAQSAVVPRFAQTTDTFITADELEKLMKEFVPQVDILIHVAAVADFSVQKMPGKISSEQTRNLQLQPRRKILDQVKTWNPQIYLVAFKAESGLSETDLALKAKQRLHQSSADAIVANEIGQFDRGFQVDTNEIIVIKKNGSIKKIPLATKSEIAQQLVEYLFAD